MRVTRGLMPLHSSIQCRPLVVEQPVPVAAHAEQRHGRMTEGTQAGRRVAGFVLGANYYTTSCSGSLPGSTRYCGTPDWSNTRVFWASMPAHL